MLWLLAITNKLVLWVGGVDNFMAIWIGVIVIEVVSIFTWSIWSSIKRRQSGIQVPENETAMETAEKIIEIQRLICVNEWKRANDSNPTDFFWAETLRRGMLEILDHFFDDEGRAEVIEYLQEKYKDVLEPDI